MSASSLEREDLCPPSAALPQVVDVGDEESRDRGRVIHAFIASVVMGTPRELALAAVPDDDWRATCAGIRVADLVEDLRDVRAEAAYALDAETLQARFLGAGIDRAYGFLATWETAGTNDLEGVRPDGLVTVKDWKTGNNVTPVRDNPQLGFYAAARAAVARVSRVRAVIQYIGANGRVRATDEHVFGAFDLDDFHERHLSIRRRVAEAKRQIRAGEVPTVYPGDHCRWCPALQACPAHVSLVRATVSATHLGPIPLDGALSISEIAPIVAAMPPEDQARAWDLANRGLRVFDAIKESLKLVARQSPIRLENGQTLALGKEFDQARFSQTAAVELLRAKGATEEEIAELWTSTTTSQVRARGKATKRHLKVVA